MTDQFRALLAEADGPAVPDGREPASVALQPSDGEVAELVEWLHRRAAEVQAENCTTIYSPHLRRVADLLAQRHPAAVPVAMIELITDMAMHLAHMQELLEDYEYGDPEDYHWYRESVRLRAVAAEVLA